MSRAQAAIAILLAVVHLCAPLAHGHGAGTAGWAELCTADGLRRLPAGDDPAPLPYGDEHCVLCRLAETTVGPPPHAPTAVAVATAAVVAIAAPAAIVHRPTSHDAPARAPPRAAA